MARTAVLVEPEVTVARIQSSTKRAIRCRIIAKELLNNAILHLPLHYFIFLIVSLSCIFLPVKSFTSLPVKLAIFLKLRTV